MFLHVKLNLDGPFFVQTEKEIVMDMIRAVSTSDREFREGYNEVVRSPTYDDQMLQQESSLEIEDIKKYNDEKRKEREEEERKKKQEETEPTKPRYGKLNAFFVYKRDYKSL